MPTTSSRLSTVLLATAAFCLVTACNRNGDAGKGSGVASGAGPGGAPAGGSGGTLKYTFTGTGLDLLGPDDGSAKLEVTLDGQVTAASAGTAAAQELYQTFTLRGLGNASHTVQLRVPSGTLVVDAVAVVAAPI